MLGFEFGKLTGMGKTTAGGAEASQNSDSQKFVNYLKKQGDVTEEEAKQLASLPLESLAVIYADRFEEYQAENGKSDTDSIFGKLSSDSNTVANGLSVEDMQQALDEAMAEAEGNIPSFDDLDAGNTSKARSTRNADLLDNIRSRRTSDASGVDALSSLGSLNGKTSAQIEEEIKELEAEKKANMAEIQKYEAKIKELTQSVKDGMAEAKELQKEAIEDHKEEANQVVDSNIAAYVAANQNGGEGMSKEQLESNISQSMPDAPNLAKALAKYVTASRELSEIDNLLEGLNTVILETDQIEADIETKTAEKEVAKKAEEASKNSGCDPIGFEKDGARYDFIVDDGNFDSTSDFLGAEDQWAAMQKLDTDGDNIVSAQELSDGGIKLLKTNPDGSQEKVDPTELGDDFSVDLNSYQQGGSYDGIGNTDSDGDGMTDQQLLGTFNVNIGGQSIKGYNTYDDVDYLASEYGVDIAEEASAKDKQPSSLHEDLQPHEEFYNEFTEISQQLQEELAEGLDALGVSEDTIDKINKYAKEEADKDAARFSEQMKAEEAQEEAQERAQEAEDTEAQDPENAQAEDPENAQAQETDVDAENPDVQEGQQDVILTDDTDDNPVAISTTQDDNDDTTSVEDDEDEEEKRRKIKTDAQQE